MDLRVIGCHGGETPKHRTSGFLLRAGSTAAAPYGRSIAIDAGCLTTGLTLAEQRSLDAVLVSHAHLDHVKDLACLTDNRCQCEAPPLIVAATAPTLAFLQKHFFNGFLWPDFSLLPSRENPTIVYQTLIVEETNLVAGFEVKPVNVSHSIDCTAFIVREPGQGAIVYSGDTGPTERLWEILNAGPSDVRALMLEVSLPDVHAALARASGHLTPASLEAELKKFARTRDVPTFLYHIKPVFEREVERELATLRTDSALSILRIGDEFLV